MTAYREILSRYEQPQLGRSVRQLGETTMLYALTWYLAYRSLELSYVLTLALCVVASGLLVRLFIIQHDCGHGSFFPSRRANDWIGRTLGVVTLTPYRYWRRFHATHHATSGQLDHRDRFDFRTLTVAEYRQLPWWERLGYRLYRNPLVLYGLGAPLWFVVFQRWPLLAPRSWPRERRSILGTDLAIAAVGSALALTLGPRQLVLVQAPITVLAAAAGMWLFYVQHQFEETYWAGDDTWEFAAASLAGSSFLDLPEPLRWLTGDIGIHHVHHLSTRIPNYRLRECVREHPELAARVRLTLRDALRCTRLKLWDPDRRRLVGFP